MQRWTFHIALCLWLAIMAGFKLLIRPPMPASVLTIYMVLVTLGIMIFVAANEARFQAFLAPLKAVFEGRAPKLVQALVLAGIPLLVAWGTWLRTAPSYDAPFEARLVHPQPPSAMQLSGKKLNLAGLQNPLRANAADLEKHTARARQSITRTASIAMATHSLAMGISPTRLRRSRRISAMSAPFRCCRNPSFSGALPPAGRACPRVRRRGSPRCRCGRTFSPKTKSGRPSFTSMRVQVRRRAPGKRRRRNEPAHFSDCGAAGFKRVRR